MAGVDVRWGGYRWSDSLEWMSLDDVLEEIWLGEMSLEWI